MYDFLPCKLVERSQVLDILQCSCRHPNAEWMWMGGGIWSFKTGMDEASSYSKKRLCSLLADREQTMTQSNSTPNKEEQERKKKKKQMECAFLRNVPNRYEGAIPTCS